MMHKRCKIALIIIAIGAPFVSLGIMKWIAGLEGDCLAVPDNVSAWFGYSASYLGAVSSSLIGILTIRLTMVLERIHKNEQNKLRETAAIEKMPDLTCEKCVLYECGHDTPYQHLDKLPAMKDYILELHLSPAFPIFFDVKVKSIDFKWKMPCVKNGTLKAEEKNASLTLKDEDYKFTNNEDFELAVYFDIDSEKKKAFQCFYEEYLYSPLDYNNSENVIELEISMECRNILLLSGAETDAISFNLCLTMENKGKNADKNGVMLNAIDRKLRG